MNASQEGHTSRPGVISARPDAAASAVNARSRDRRQSWFTALAGDAGIPGRAAVSGSCVGWRMNRDARRGMRRSSRRAPCGYPDRTSTGRRRRASDQVLTAGRSPPAFWAHPLQYQTGQGRASGVVSTVEDR